MRYGCLRPWPSVGCGLKKNNFIFSPCPPEKRCLSCSKQGFLFVFGFFFVLGPIFSSQTLPTSTSCVKQVICNFCVKIRWLADGQPDLDKQSGQIGVSLLCLVTPVKAGVLKLRLSENVATWLCSMLRSPQSFLGAEGALHTTGSGH